MSDWIHRHHSVLITHHSSLLLVPIENKIATVAAGGSALGMGALYSRGAGHFEHFATETDQGGAHSTAGLYVRLVAVPDQARCGAGHFAFQLSHSLEEELIDPGKLLHLLDRVLDYKRTVYPRICVPCHESTKPYGRLLSRTWVQQPQKTAKCGERVIGVPARIQERRR